MSAADEESTLDSEMSYGNVGAPGGGDDCGWGNDTGAPAAAY